MEKMLKFKFHVEIPNSEARMYLIKYDALRCDILVEAHCLEDAYNIVDAIFLSSPFVVHPVLMR